MTEEENRDRLKQFVVNAKGHPLVWMADHVKIRDKGSEIIPLKLNKAQRIVLSVIERLNSENKAIRILLLKARQMGMTSLGLALQYCLCNKNPNKKGLIASHTDKSSVEIFEKIKLMESENPESLTTDYTNRREIIYAAPHRSTIKIETGGNQNLGRGITYDYLHCSELAIWANAKESLLSVLQSIPRKKGTIVIIESTASGVGGEFWERWQKAIKGESEYEPVFLPWFIFDEYRLSTPEGFTMTPDELTVAEKYKLEPEQVYWRRVTIENECGGDLEKFWQEYPSNSRECFLHSGRPVFNMEMVENYQVRCYPPDHKGELNKKGEEIKFEPNERGILEVWQLPRPGELYVIGCDPSEGIVKENNPDPDYTSIVVLNVKDMSVVALINARIEEEECGRYVDMLCRYYNNALSGFEVNNTCGGAVREVVKRLQTPNLYFTRQYNKLTDKTTEVVGYKTTKENRGLMISDLKEVVNSGSIDVYSDRIVNEMSLFCINEKGKPEAKSGHDDNVMALCIGYQMLLQVYNYLPDDGIEHSTLDPHVPGSDAKVFIPGKTLAGELFKLDDDVDEIFD